MNKKQLVVFVLTWAALLISAQTMRAQGFRAGYGLVFSIHSLNSSKIQSEFKDLPAGGHSSFFFLEKSLNKNLSIRMSPGALNFEDEKTQFHVQYNLISLNYKLNTVIFPIIGTGAGGCIATLSHGDGKAGEVQSGIFLKNSVFMWMANLGVGYKFKNQIELIIEMREIGYFDSALKNLNSLNLGATVSMKL